MLYTFLYPWHETFSLLHVFKYITFRTFGGLFTALFFYFLIGRWVIRFCQQSRWTQVIRKEGPQSHYQKQGTPTMGGLAILFAVLFSALLWIDLKNLQFWLCAGLLLFYGLIGFYDDSRKIRYGSSQGLKGRHKFLLQVMGALIVGVLLVTLFPIETKLSVPFFKNFQPDLGLFYPLFAVFVIVGASNAVNLTDGLDGLATVPLIFSFATYGLFAYIAGHFAIATYLQIPYLVGTGELSIFCGAMIGALLGFLWFNTYPAEIFMGDVGSLSLGGVLGLLALLTKNEILLAVVGGLFVLETVSVMTQVLSFRLTGKRIFRMAPIHHHFELKGWPEAKVSVRFWIISFLLSLVAIATLKLR
ncbi:MAG: phospho-N-acetylmuramoyl-pentapeptide-transferase [Deltaproteobacteria bacterium]|nr:phospho-N-acetylmuramoyl-pentapeptide-transferase [Deltaproteobacteria bacterium]